MDRSDPNFTAILHLAESCSEAQTGSQQAWLDRCKTLADGHRQCDAELAELRAKCEAAEQRNKGLSSELQGWMNSNEEACRRADAANSEVLRLAADRDQQRERADRAESNVEHHVARLDAIHNVLHSSGQWIKGVKADSDRIAAELAAANEQLASTKTQADQIAAECGEVRGQLAANERRLRDISGERDCLFSGYRTIMATLIASGVPCYLNEEGRLSGEGIPRDGSDCVKTLAEDRDHWKDLAAKAADKLAAKERERAIAQGVLDELSASLANEKPGDIEHLIACGFIGKATAVIGRSRLNSLCDAEKKLAELSQPCKELIGTAKQVASRLKSMPFENDRAHGGMLLCHAENLEAAIDGIANAGTFDVVEPEGLPELTDAMKARMDEMPADIVSQLWDDGNDDAEPSADDATRIISEKAGLEKQLAAVREQRDGLVRALTQKEDRECGWLSILQAIKSWVVDTKHPVNQWATYHAPLVEAAIAAAKDDADHSVDANKMVEPTEPTGYRAFCHNRARSQAAGYAARGEQPPTLGSEADNPHVSPPLEPAGTQQVRYTDAGELPPRKLEDEAEAPEAFACPRCGWTECDDRGEPGLECVGCGLLVENVGPRKLTDDTEANEQFECPHCKSRRFPYSKPDGKVCATCGKRIDADARAARLRREHVKYLSAHTIVCGDESQPII